MMDEDDEQTLSTESGRDPDPPSPSRPTAKVRAPGGLDDFEGQRQKRLIAAAIFGRAPSPTTFDRYVVIRELGAGGMGKVYLAYDEQLDRRVALKLLHGGRSSPAAKIRLQREAQAMAKLSHPNVVAVYEVGGGEEKGELYVAMEYVEGQDLREWLADGSRSLDEIRAVFLAAGTGLAAAHDAGLVHRDFKPDNVLVGKDGRVRVADFGLVHGLFGENDPEQLADVGGPSKLLGTKGAVSLTRTGTLLGTPAYMSPEQFLCRATDARSDQFSFCVALWEALHGSRPFSGETMPEIAEQVIEGRMARLPESSVGGARAWIHAVVLRGLSTDPELRWPSMHDLLAALADDPAARRRRRFRAVALIGSISALLVTLSVVATRELRANARQRYWNGLTEQLLEIERERGFRQAGDDAQRARDATKMSVYRSYRAKVGIVDHEDPTLAAVLLREVGEEARADEAWISAANLSLGRPLSHAQLIGHRDTIFALLFAADEQTLYSAAADGEVRRWTLASGRGEALYHHDAAVNDLALSPDGGILASASEDGTVRLWRSEDGDTGEIRFRGEAGITSVDFDPLGRVLVATARDGTSRLLDLSSGRDRVLEDQDQPIHAASFDREGRRLLTGAGDGKARLWRVVDGTPLATLSGHTAAVYHVRFASDDWAITGADDGTVRAWQVGDLAEDLEDGQASRILVDHGAAITALAIDGSTVASGAVDGSVYVTEIAGEGQAEDAPVKIPGHDAGVWALALSPGGGEVITAAFDGTARVGRSDGRGPAQVLVGHREPLLRLALAPSGRWLATGSWDTEIRVWDLHRPALETPLLGHRDKLQSVRVDHTGDRVLTASSDRSARIWDARSGVARATFEGRRPLNIAIFSPDGSRVAMGHDNGDVVLWDPIRGDHRMLGGHSLGIRDLSFSRSGAHLASASSDGTARIWRVGADEIAEDRDAPLVLAGHRGLVLRITHTHAGDRVITASSDATLGIWDAHDGTRLATLEGHEGAIRGLALSPDGTMLASASDDHCARLWPDFATHDAIVLTGHDLRVQSIAFDRGGARVVTASADGSARVWDTSEGSLLATLRGHGGALWGARFVGDDRIVTAGDDNSVRLWSLDGDDPAIVLTGHEGAVYDLDLDPGARFVVSASVDGRARIWRLDQLSFDPRVLGQRLREASLACMGAEQRILELGEGPAEAAAAVAACRRGP